MLPLFDRTGRLPVLLHDALDRGALILTANLRAARSLETAYAEDQRSRGVLAWPRPRILDWNSWVGELWEQYALTADDASMPLTALQERQLWVRVQGRDRDRVVAPERMAELAQEAYGLLGSYSAHPLRRGGHRLAEVHEDAERFLAWAESFDLTCRQHQWLSRTRLEERLTAGVGLLDAPGELYLVGFDRTTPAQAALLGALEAAGTRVSRHAPGSGPGKPRLLAAKDQRAEFEACAWWCREQMAEDSTRRIGVIAPDLGRARAELDRVFRRILMPQTTLWQAGADPALPYEFSLGAPLASLTGVRAALLVLRWLSGPISAAELTWLLTSGYLAASPADEQALARLDAELGRAGGRSPEVVMGWLLERPWRHLPGELRARLVRLQARAAGERLLPGPRDRAGRDVPTAAHRSTYARWAELAPSLLRDAGWPGHREADSFSYQAQQRFTRLLGELAELGFDGAQPSWSEFLSTLTTEAHAVIFAAESSSPPIQILGAFESSGQSFDALWFLGADDEHWPAVGRPHPLLPAWLQRDAGMPHATPDADWLLAQGATARIVASAPVVVLSFPLQEGGTALRASPLLRAHAAQTEAAPVVAAAWLRAAGLERVEDDSGTLPWPAEQNAGGAEVLRRQAACAFQSFAIRRLQGRALEQAPPGLSAADRGTTIHAVLERLWSAKPGDPLRLHTHDDLRRAMADGSIHTMLTHHIREIFAPMVAARHGDGWGEAYLACEQQRVQERLLVWLELELERRPFRIAALELKVDEMMVGPLRLRVRLDRVDRLADGTQLLIDYKTGLVKPGAWMSERPEEPQLPLYALFGGLTEVSGVAFAQIRADQTRLLARAADVAAMVSEKLGGVSEKNRFDDEIRDGWREALLALAEQFGRGEAMVNPRQQASTCLYCPLAGLCRVHAAGTAGTVPAEEQGEDE